MRVYKEWLFGGEAREAVEFFQLPEHYRQLDRDDWYDGSDEHVGGWFGWHTTSPIGYDH
jgi:hypothetical protein